MVDLPNGVHHVKARGNDYFYWHPGRGTKHEGARVRLPNDPTDPSFWVELRRLQDNSGVATELTVSRVIELYEASPKFLGLADGTQSLYKRQFKLLRAGYGTWPADRMKSSHIREAMEGLAAKPSAANNFLRATSAVSSWGIVRNYFTASLTDGVEAYTTRGGHRPWTDAQIKAAHDHLTGHARRMIMLALYTGQRGSDIVRMGWTDVDEEGFRLVQGKTRREIWCPIVDELAAEMATWGKAPGPFVRQESGKPYTRKLFSKHFKEIREETPGLSGVTIHGLRATAVIRLRRAGLTTPQIQDIIGLSMPMIERYSRFADKKASGKAAVVKLSERRNAGGTEHER